MPSNYKYYTGLTSQLPFCSTPLRLDPYNNCAFSCSYCYASSRQGFGRQSKLKISNPETLRSRLSRISEGIIKSSVDEFMGRKVPFQLGGMSDPFGPLEEKHGITFKMLMALKDFKYPFLISTKSAMPALDKYLKVLIECDTIVRFSITAVDGALRHKIDKGCDSSEELFKAMHILSLNGVNTSLRIQPVIPGHEHSAFKLIDEAAKVGVSHISVEYLKVPIDANKKFGSDLRKIMLPNPISLYRNLNAEKQGREYILPLNYRSKYLVEMKRTANEQGMSMGFADNDLLLHSDGSSCCNGANLYLKDANYHEANVASLAKSKSVGDNIHFSDFLTRWLPEYSVSSHLNSKARIPAKDLNHEGWLGYLQKMWQGEYSLYKPDYFDGVEFSGQFDNMGLPIYVRVQSEFGRKIQSFEPRNLKTC